MNVSDSDFPGEAVVILRMALAWNLAYVLLSPVFALVLVLGLRRCRKRSSRRPPAPPHSDVFTFNMAAFEMLAVLGSAVNVAGMSVWRADLLPAGDVLCYMTTLGQALFHCLVSAERHLAVVHPVVYLRLKEKGVVVRNVSVLVVWLFSAGMTVVYSYRFPLLNQISELIIGFFSLFFITSFCVSVLCVLIRPGPGDRGGVRKHVDKSKRRAFYTIAAITAAMMLKFFAMFASRVVFLSDPLHKPRFRDYLLVMAALWFYIPSSLVMPLLFLYKHVQRHKRPKSILHGNRKF